MYQEISNYNTILIDLDDTLYPEEEFLFAAYKNIATYMSEKNKLCFCDIYNFLTLEFKKKGRYQLFDKFITHFHLEAHTISSCLSIMRQTLVRPKIQLFPVSKALLEYCIENNKTIFVITNLSFVV
jgi:FMN phosphatase YigB (HAD superfamily)